MGNVADGRARGRSDGDLRGWGRGWRKRRRRRHHCSDVGKCRIRREGGRDRVGAGRDSDVAEGKGGRVGRRRKCVDVRVSAERQRR